MSRKRSALGRLMVVAMAGALGITPRDSAAMVGGGLGFAAFSSKFVYGVCNPVAGTIWTCNKVGVRLDPQGDVTHITLTLDYDLFGPQFVFSPTESGPLDIFSVGGSSPAATPGSGTQPFTIFSALPDTPGTALPGSTLTVTDNTLAVTVDYLLATPLNVPTETNFFVLVFDFITPISIDAAFSTVTYSPLALFGADFTETYFNCESGDPSYPSCGSTEPTQSLTLDLKVVPEPMTVWLLGTGVTLMAAMRRRRLA